ncbi:hypothetical protein HETIRDRAFT_145093, partial [Heterobasidion irregulare TC 32-1]
MATIDVTPSATAWRPTGPVPMTILSWSKLRSTYGTPVWATEWLEDCLNCEIQIQQHEVQPNNIVYEQRRIVLDGSDTLTDADIARKEGYRAKAEGVDGLTLREKRGGDGRLAGA